MSLEKWFFFEEARSTRWNTRLAETQPGLMDCQFIANEMEIKRMPPVTDISNIGIRCIFVVDISQVFMPPISC